MLNFNQYDCSINLTLTPDCLNATGNATWGSVRVNAKNTIGKYYFEVVANASNSNLILGVMNKTAPLSGFIGNDTLGWSYQTGGNKRHNGAFTAYGDGSDTSTATYMVAYQAPNIWFGRNGVWFENGNPVQNTNPAFSNLSGDLYPAISLASGSCVLQTQNMKYLPEGYSVPSEIVTRFPTNDLVKFNHSSFTGTKSISGQIGKLLWVFRDILTDGYNYKNVTNAVISNGVCTVTTSIPHEYQVNQVVNFMGANEAFFNDDFRIETIPTTTSFTFSTTLTGSITGSITVRIAPLHFEIVYGKLNKLVFRSRNVFGNRYYLQVEDSTTGNAIITVYDSMDTADIGYNQTTEVYFPKSTDTSTTARTWAIQGNTDTFFYTVALTSSPQHGDFIGVFGDICSKKPNDSGATIINGWFNNSTSNYGTHPSMGGFLLLQSFGGFYLTKNKFGLPNESAKLSVFGIANGGTNQIIAGNDKCIYPVIGDGVATLFRLIVIESSSYSFRGFLPGFFCPHESIPTYFFPKYSLYTDKDNNKYIVWCTSYYNTLSVAFISLESKHWRVF